MLAGMGLARYAASMANPALEQVFQKVIIVMIPVMILAGIANSLPNKSNRKKTRQGTRTRKYGWADDLVLAPWWMSFGLAVLAFTVLPRLVPATAFLAPIVTLFLLFLSVMSLLRKWKTRRMLDEQTGLDSLCQLPSKRFEDLLGEAYRRQGYKVEETLGGGADGGVDLILGHDGDVTLVQCKRWKDKPVRVQTVRELYGIMHDRRASATKLVTTSSFTSEAIAFAEGKPIQLLDGRALLELLQSVQTSPNIVVPGVRERDHLTPDCPQCGAEMVMRTAKRGPNPGNKFWGCPNYSKTGCKGVREI